MQRLAGPPFGTPTEVVRHALAVQAQDWPGAKWGIGQRVAGAVEADLDRLLDSGAVVRTHVMRPTWHVVAVGDVRWLLELTAPRVQQVMAYQYRRHGIDAEVAARARAALERALAGGAVMTRDELRRELVAAGLDGPALRQAHLILHAELERVIVSGPRRGRAQTYALFDERVPASPHRPRDEALSEIGRRFVAGHGPAQAIDLAWWSGLTLGDARTALEAASPPLLREVAGPRTFFVDPDERRLPVDRPIVHLLPNYDELLIAFRDRSDATDPRLPEPARLAEVVLAHVVVRDGLVVGGWRRRDSRAGAGAATEVDATLLVPLDTVERAALVHAVEDYARFLGRPVELAFSD